MVSIGNRTLTPNLLLVFAVAISFIIMYVSITANEYSEMSNEFSGDQSSTKRITQFNVDIKLENFTQSFFNKSCYSNFLNTIYYFKQFIHENKTEPNDDSHSNSSCLKILCDVSTFSK